MGFRLRIAEGSGPSKGFNFAQPAVKIGRMPDNDLVVYDTSVSRYHCEIVADGDGHTLRDTGSVNGTLLNEVMTTEAPIRVGDELQVGPVIFVFEALSQKEDEESVSLPSRQEMLRPLTDSQCRKLEEHPTFAVSRSMVEARSEQQEREDLGSGVDSAAHQRKRGAAVLPRSARLAILVGLGFFCVGGILSAVFFRGGWRRDRSAEIFPINGTNATLSFGAGEVDVFTPDRASFEFEYEGGRATVQYAAEGVELANELEILLNGRPVAHVRASPGRWQTGLATPLPRATLTPGMNVLTFNNRSTPMANKRWGVAQVQVFQEKLPPPDKRLARQLFSLGEAAYGARSVSPQNMWHAVQYYRQARLYLEALEKSPPVMARIAAAERRATEQLQVVFDSHILAADAAIRSGQLQTAVAALRRALRFFPDDADERRDSIKRRLADLIGRR